MRDELNQRPAIVPVELAIAAAEIAADVTAPGSAVPVWNGTVGTPELLERVEDPVENRMATIPTTT